jgi:hypothetical protein
MYIEVHNANYGYATATYGDYVAIGNPVFLRYTGSTPDVYYTGSVDVFRYNKTTDQHDLINTLFVHGAGLETLLATELIDPLLHTEYGSYWSADLDIWIDREKYYSSIEDGTGVSLDMYAKTLVAGVPYYRVRFKTDYVELFASGSAVDIYDFTRKETIPGTDPYVGSLMNPHSYITESFGIGVGINSEWIAVGSPLVSSSCGMVYVYQNISTGSNNFSWSLFQTITSPNPMPEQQFGRSVKLNKQSGYYSSSMVVGCGLSSSNEAYYFEFISGSWISSYTFKPTTDIYPLTFGNYPPYAPTMSLNSGFGYDVSLFNNSVIIGAYADRLVYEYTGSSQFQQGAVYIFEKCHDVPLSKFRLALKTYGTPLTLRNNRMGFSVDMFDKYAVAGIPKIDSLDMTPCFVQGTLGQLHYCDQALEDMLQGQAMLLEKNTSSLDWEIINVYQKKKRFLSPHRHFGWDVSVDGRSMVVGAPMYYSGSRFINIETTASSGVTIDDIAGKAYIYNFPNLRPEFHVGNVFYRNGKIVIMTSGSAFNGLFLNPVSNINYEYDLTYNSQRTIHEQQILCNVEPGEFNVSTNPSAIMLPSSTLDLNKNGKFDFQDVDVLLRYLQYKQDSTTDWSSSILSADDEISFYNYNASQWNNTDSVWSSSFYRFENVDTTFIDSLDINSDNKINGSDMIVLWKYFSNRLEEKNYNTCVNINCKRKLVSEAISYLNSISKRHYLPQISPEFFNYDTLSAGDKTGSFLAPMVSTIGLFDGLDLVAVAKLGSPVKLPKTLSTNFCIKMDY